MGRVPWSEGVIQTSQHSWKWEIGGSAGEKHGGLSQAGGQSRFETYREETQLNMLIREDGGGRMSGSERERDYL